MPLHPDTPPAGGAEAPRRRKKPPQNPVLPEHREKFEQFLMNWQEVLGLVSWRINLSKKRPTGDNAADVECFQPDRMARVRLADDLGGSVTTDENLEAYAVHELLHVLLVPLVDQEASGLEGEALSAYEHVVINTLQKLLTRGRI
jgi:hypothetical protein